MFKKLPYLCLVYFIAMTPKPAGAAGFCQSIFSRIRYGREVAQFLDPNLTRADRVRMVPQLSHEAIQKLTILTLEKGEKEVFSQPEKALQNTFERLGVIVTRGHFTKSPEDQAIFKKILDLIGAVWGFGDLAKQHDSVMNGLRTIVNQAAQASAATDESEKPEPLRLAEVYHHEVDTRLYAVRLFESVMHNKELVPTGTVADILDLLTGMLNEDSGWRPGKPSLSFDLGDLFTTTETPEIQRVILYALGDLPRGFLSAPHLAAMAGATDVDPFFYHPDREPVAVSNPEARRWLFRKFGLARTLTAVMEDQRTAPEVRFAAKHALARYVHEGELAAAR